MVTVSKNIQAPALYVSRKESRHILETNDRGRWLFRPEFKLIWRLFKLRKQCKQNAVFLCLLWAFSSFNTRLWPRVFSALGMPHGIMKSRVTVTVNFSARFLLGHEAQADKASKNTPHTYFCI